MPELPEVETVCRGMEQALSGLVIEKVRINRYDLRVPVPQDLGQSISGQVLNGLERRGKYIIMHIGQDISVILHLGMSGRVRIYEDEASYDVHKHDHIVVHMVGGACFAFEDPRRFGMFYLSGQDIWQEERPFSQMGPEPLGGWCAKDLHDSLRKKKSPIKTALLDQRIVCGLGNIYVCEALHRAGIHPARRAESLSLEEVEKLVPYIKDVLSEAIEAGGSTLKDYQHTDGSLGYFQHRFAVYDQENAACPKDGCDGVIERMVQSGRSTFYCGACQK